MHDILRAVGSHGPTLVDGNHLIGPSGQPLNNNTRLIDVDEFLPYYLRYHGHALRLEDYGVNSVLELIEKIPEIAQVRIVYPQKIR